MIWVGNGLRMRKVDGLLRPFSNCASLPKSTIDLLVPLSWLRLWPHLQQLSCAEELDGGHDRPQCVVVIAAKMLWTPRTPSLSWCGGTGISILSCSDGTSSLQGNWCNLASHGREGRHLTCMEEMWGTISLNPPRLLKRPTATMVVHVKESKICPINKLEIKVRQCWHWPASGWL